MRKLAKKIIKFFSDFPFILVILVVCLAFLVTYQIVISVNRSPNRISIQVIDVSTEESEKQSAAVLYCKILNNSNRDCTYLDGSLKIKDASGATLTQNDWSFGSWGNFTLPSGETKEGSLTIYCQPNDKLMTTPYNGMTFDIITKNVTYSDPPLSIFRILYKILVYPLFAVFVFFFGLALTLAFGWFMSLFGIPITSPSETQQKKENSTYWDAKKRYDSAARNYRNAMNSPGNADNARRYQSEMELAKVDMINSGYTSRPGNSSRAYWDAKKRYESAAHNYRNAMNSPGNADNARRYQSEMEIAKIEMINSGYHE